MADHRAKESETPRAGARYLADTVKEVVTYCPICAPVEFDLPPASTEDEPLGG